MLKPILRERRVFLLLALTTALIALSAVAAFGASGKSVKVKDDLFAPKSLTISKGTKVTWQWAGSLRHNVTVKSGPSKFKSKTQVRGSFNHTFSKAGTYHLFCTVHPFMKMTIVVK
jgi:plastocyanin